MKMNKLNKIEFWIIVITAVVFYCLCAILAHASTTSQHKNSLGVIIPYENPNLYLAGNIISGALIESGDKRFLNIRVQPSHTFTLYTEEVLFCRADTVLEKFINKQNPVVLIYERIAHDSIDKI